MDVTQRDPDAVSLDVPDRLRRWAVPDVDVAAVVRERKVAAFAPHGRRVIAADLPGFGEMKVKALGAVLWKRFGVPAAEELDPGHPTLGDVDSPQALEDYQAKKRAYKAKLRAQQ